MNQQQPQGELNMKKVFPILIIFGAIILIVLLIESSMVIFSMYKVKRVDFELRLMLGNLGGMVLGFIAGIFVIPGKDFIKEKIKDKVLRESIFFSLPVVFTLITVLLLCFYDQSVIMDFIILKKSPTKWGVFLFMGLSGLTALRLSLLLMPRVRLINFISGLASLSFYFYTVIKFIP